ncbi:hypothetical protein DK389_20970 [Methylobacterium durans]|uniref:Uncharacterized protein n=1 Tax=Methylobacterium durans TaxID=2202825 RepID=A0A2U8WAA6_9HYPH|nr:hypothetical protein DK389_20970 [Methylobacterium durans]
MPRHQRGECLRSRPLALAFVLALLAVDDPEDPAHRLRVEMHVPALRVQRPGQGARFATPGPSANQGMPPTSAATTSPR